MIIGEQYGHLTGFYVERVKAEQNGFLLKTHNDIQTFMLTLMGEMWKYS